MIINEQQIIPAYGHNVIIDHGYPATCTESGYSDGAHCDICGEIIREGMYISPLGHDYHVVEGVPATESEDGMTAGVQCSRCGDWLLEQEVIPAQHVPIMYGDLDGDGRVDVNDATVLQRYIAEYTDLSDRQLAAADVNGDGMVTIDDVTHLQRYLAEYDVILGA